MEKYHDQDSGENYYHNKFRRLFYLANDFGLDYQPRVMLFVEGATELRVLPKVFSWYYDKPENHGIEIVNFEGVNSLLSTSESARKLRNLIIQLQKERRQQILSNTQRTRLNEIIGDLSNLDIVISNWTSFISYNLEKWQIIPFFVSDNEGNVKHFLEAEKPIKFNGANYDFPSKWKYLWGDDNKNKPFRGKDFEFANFSDKEIAKAIRAVLNIKGSITANSVKKIRNQDSGIKHIHTDIERIR